MSRFRGPGPRHVLCIHGGALETKMEDPKGLKWCNGALRPVFADSLRNCDSQMISFDIPRKESWKNIRGEKKGLASVHAVHFLGRVLAFCPHVKM